MKYQCLILDHDDTVVQSSREIHYPAFQETLETLRTPSSFTYEDFMRISFDPGVLEYYRNHFGFSEQEIAAELHIWKSHVARTVPAPFEGLVQIIRQFRQQGGIIAISSHNMEQYIRRDYLSIFGFAPDEIFGYDSPDEYVKPHTGGIQYLLDKYSLNVNDCLMVDDLRPGFDMAKSLQLPFAAAGYSIVVETTKSFFKQHADYYLDEPGQLGTILF